MPPQAEREPDRSRAADRPADAPILVLITAPDATVGAAIARELVQARLAACVNVVPGLTSIYRWQGAVEQAEEVLLVVKSVAARRGDLERALARIHPYELPELVVLEPAHVEARYLAWLRAQCGADG